MTFTQRMLPGFLAAAALWLCGLDAAVEAGGTERGTAAAKAGDMKAGAGAEKPTAKGGGKGAEKPDAERPACMHCGATCGLEAVCICKPGTKKIQKTEYEATCDPICVPCCSGPPWPWGRTGAKGGCTGCVDECPDAWVRQRKKLVVEKKDEEKPTIERKVAWVCRACDPDRPVSCTGHAAAAPSRTSWWPTWLPHP